jgi:hypothetical protein
MGGFRGKSLAAVVIGVVMTVVAASGAAADSTRSVKIVRAPSFFTALNPCNAQPVQTLGTVRVQVATDENDVTPDSDTPASVHLRDTQTGGGYKMLELADGEFSAISSSYALLPVTVVFTNGALSFYGIGETIVYVDGTGTPIGASTITPLTYCGTP